MTHRQAVGRLVLVALVWGASFTLTKQALAAMSPLVFMGTRFLIATLLVAGTLRDLRRPELRAGLLLGVLFWGGFVFQTAGLRLTTPSRSAFITSLSAILTPVLTVVVHRTAPGKLTVGAIVLATAGMYLLTAPDAGGVNAGDLLTVGCALLFTGQIVAASHYARRFAPVRLLAMQLGLTTILSFAAAPLLETPKFAPDMRVAVIVGVLALSGLWSFHTQLRAQRHVGPSEAALVFMLEPVFAAAVSFWELGERFSPLQLTGSALILAAMAIQPVSELAKAAARPRGPRRRRGAAA